MKLFAFLAGAALVGVVASGCCCPCSYLNGLPDVATTTRPELAPTSRPQARAPVVDPR